MPYESSKFKHTLSTFRQKVYLFLYICLCFFFIPQEKRLACERYTEVNEELSGMKGRSEREIQNLKEHLRLAMAALQEGQKLGNSLDH